LEILDPLAFITGDAAHDTLINIGTTEPTVDRLRNRPELAGNRRDRCPLRVVLVSVCPHQPNGLPPDLLWVLACSCHSSILSKVGASIRPGEVHNQVEIELSVLHKQCLGGRRIAEEEMLRGEVGAWQRERNDRGATVAWRFTAEDARKKLARLYPAES
jgi:hypothetical protein